MTGILRDLVCELTEHLHFLLMKKEDLAGPCYLISKVVKTGTFCHTMRLFLEDVHFMMSAALPFVNCISHIVKTCVRGNFRSYPITVNKNFIDFMSHVVV